MAKEKQILKDIEKTFVFEVNQIFYELLFNLVAQEYFNEDILENIINNEGERIWFTLNNLISYKNLLIETGGEIREKIVL